MTSATKTESRAHPAGTRTSYAPRRLAIRCGFGRLDQPAMSCACPWPEPQEAPVEAPRTGRVTHEPACTQRCGGRLSNARTPHSSPRATPRAWIARADDARPRHSFGVGPRERNQRRRVPGCFPPPGSPRGCNSPRVVLALRWCKHHQTRITHFSPGTCATLTGYPHCRTAGRIKPGKNPDFTRARCAPDSLCVLDARW